jgi:hypothetical protein
VKDKNLNLGDESKVEKSEGGHENEAEQQEKPEGANRTEEVLVVLNEETGIGGYTFADGKTMLANKVYSISQEQYDEYMKDKAAVGGGREMSRIRKH